MNTRYPVLLAVAALAVATSLPALSADFRVPLKESDFYGGIGLRSPGAEGMGITFGHLASDWMRFASPTSEDAASRTVMYGGYRLRSDLAVEAAVETTERYALQRADALGRSGIGLSLPGFAPESAARTVNVDVYGSWAFWRSFSLYGRFGYAQADASAVVADPRRSRDGLNYGVGLRYDMNRSFGLKLEYARFGHLFGETAGTSLPESDQVQFGLQYRF
jgi:opacity protein-like surface antigen